MTKPTARQPDREERREESRRFRQRIDALRGDRTAQRDAVLQYLRWKGGTAA